MSSSFLPCRTKKPELLLQFKDRARQKQRQQTLKHRASQDKQPGSKTHKSKSPLVQPGKKAPAAKRRLLEKQEDDASLVEDYRQLKKLKSGRISEVPPCSFELALTGVLHLAAARYCEGRTSGT